MAHAPSTTKLSKRFTESDMAKLQRSDIEQEELRHFLHKGRRLSEREHAALKLDSVDAFEVFWKTTTDAQATFNAKHEHGANRRMRQVQNFGEAASDMMRQLEPMVQAVRDFGYPFGGLAVGTIAFLFTIAQNKASIERQVVDTLQQIRDRIAGFRVYERIYNDYHDLDQQLQSQIVAAYDSFIGFCIVSTKYYSRRGIDRWLRALTGPDESIVEYSSRVQSAIVEVRQTTEELLNKNVDFIKQSNKALVLQIQQLQDDHDSDRLIYIQTLLSLSTSSQKLNWSLLSTYRHDLDVYFSDWIYVELMTDSRLIAFRDDPIVKAWRQSPHSQMLLLVGYNNESHYSSNQCWLSPVALNTIENLRDAGEADLNAFYLIGQKNSDDFRHVFSTIILQLLGQSCQSLRNAEHYTELCAELQSYQNAIKLSQQNRDNEEHLSDANNALQAAALRILNMFTPNKAVYIVLDRVDRCGSARRSADGKRLLKALVQLVEKANIRIRVLAVINGHDWHVDEQMDELGCTRPESIVCMRMEQGPLGNESH